MDIFSKNDFDKEGINFLSFEDDFSIKDSNSIIFAFNGIGKTSICKYLMTTQKEKCAFLDYYTKPDFTGKDMYAEITTKITEIEKIKSKIDEIKNKFMIKNYFKSDISNIDKAKAINEDFGSYYRDKNPFKLPVIDEKIFTSVTKCVKFEEIIQLMREYEKIKNINNLSLEIHDYSKKFLLEIYELIEKNCDNNLKECPVCGTKNIDIFKLIEEKKRKLTNLSESVFGDFSYVFTKQKCEQKKAIEEMIEISKSIDIKTLISIYISKFDYDTYRSLYDERQKLDEYEKELKNLETKRDDFYKSMSEDKEFIKENFETIYKGSTISFNDDERKITIKLPRKYSTYSTGELNELCLIINLLSFRGSSKDLLIIDDPLSSYDFINQYRILFRIADTANKEKRIIIFTHNIDTINIINSQRSDFFKYYYIEKYNNKLCLNKIELKCNGSLLSLESLKEKNDYIDLLIYRDEQNNNNFEKHKIFHYDCQYSCPLQNDSNKEHKNLSNFYFIELIENLNNELEPTKSFEDNIIKKILYICGIRVWIEKQIFDYIKKKNLSDDTCKEYEKKKTTIDKVRCADKIVGFKEEFPNFTVRKINIKKVMLNQNSHFKSQIIPFNYAMNISFDDLVFEINEIKNIFKRNIQNN